MASSIPLIRASQAAPFADRIRASGWRAEPLLEEVGIRPDLVDEHPDALVPEYAIWDLVERCARVAGTGSFGWDAGLGTPVEQLGSFGRDVASAATLRDALRLFLVAVGRHSSDASFSVARGRSGIWFRRHGIDAIDVGAWQVELYVVGLMVRVCRTALGAAWVPAELWLKQRGREPLPEPLRDARVSWGRPVTAIAIPDAALDARLPAIGGDVPPLAAIDLPLPDALRHALESLSLIHI